MKTLTFPILCPTDSEGEASNLALDRSSGALIPAPAPTLLPGAPTSAFPLLSIAGATIFADTASTPGMTALYVLPDDGAVISLGTIAGSATCAIPSGAEGSALIMTTVGVAHLSIHPDGKYTLTSPSAAPRALPSLHLHSISRVAISTSPLSFKSVDSDAASLPDAAAKSLSLALCDAYSSRAIAAASAGQWIQPLLVYFRLLGHNGQLLFTGPATLIAPPGGWQAVGELECAASRSTSDPTTLSISALSVDVQSYTLSLDFSFPLDTDVEAVELWASPQLHPIDPDELAPSRIISRSAGLRFFTAMPGATRRFASRDAERRSALLSIANALPGSAQCLGRWRLADVAGQSVAISAPAISVLTSMFSNSGAVGDSAAGNSLLGSESTTFRAGAVCTGAQSIIWGDITYPAPLPFSPVALFTGEPAESSTTPWTAAVQVDIIDGSSSVTHFAGAGPLPDSIAPLVTFPSRRAVKWRLVIESDDGLVRSISLPLSPAPSGADCALYLSPGCSQIPLPVSDDALPAESPAPMRSDPSAIIFCHTSAPLQPLRSISCGTGRVLALSDAVRSRSAWDSTNDSFIALTTEGLFSVTAYASPAHLAARRLLRAPISFPAVTTAPSGVIAATNSALFLINSGHPMTITTLAVPLRALAWHDGLAALITTDTQGNTRILYLNDNRSSAPRPLHLTLLPAPFTPSRLTPALDGGVWMSSDAGLHHLPSTPLPDTLTHVSLRTHINPLTPSFPSGNPSALPPSGLPTHIHIPIIATAITADITLRFSPLLPSQNRPAALTLSITGALTNPLLEPVLARPDTLATLTISANATPDLRLLPPSLLLYP